MDGAYIVDSIDYIVALRKESVDRNSCWLLARISARLSLSARRAWIEIHQAADGLADAPSLSARRAWIEINMLCSVEKRWAVALRKESVDRNGAVEIVVIVVHASLSARRAWIEIGVDFAEDWLDAGRSPQGERG